MKKFFAEFKEFINRGSAIDLAVGVIIGAAFQSIVTSLVNDIISPIIGLFVRQNFNDLSVSFLGITIKYGAFITAVIHFIIMAFVIFVMIKLLNSLSKIGKKVKRNGDEEEEPEPTTKTCPYCIQEIPAEAVRCPYCTSVLPEEESDDSDKNKDSDE